MYTRDYATQLAKDILDFYSGDAEPAQASLFTRARINPDMPTQFLRMISVEIEVEVERRER
jgi:hypothetical protein